MIREQRDDAIQHADIHVLSPPGPIARIQREDDALSGQQAGDQIRDGDADAERRTIGRAGHAHEAAFRLHHRVVARLMPPRSGLAETGDRAIDQRAGAWS